MDKSSEKQDYLSGISNQLADAVERVGASLVKVNGRERQAASGIVFDKELVLTASHAVEREDNLTVEATDGKEVAATLVGRDPSTDLAVLRAPGLGLEPATAASEQPRVGQLVLAVGRPASGGPQASSGIVSQVGGPLRLGHGAQLDKYLVTDAKPYPGFSGGPVIDSQGAVLGISTSGLTRGVSLAIPADIAWRVAANISQHGSIKRGYLGIMSQPVELPEGQRAGTSNEYGLLLLRVESGSPAEKGGLLLGDVLVGLEGRSINEIGDLQSVLTGDRVGKPVQVTVIRGGALQTISVTVGERE